MFDQLTDSLQRAFGRLSGRRLTSGHLDAAFREVRRALLEADVPLEVIRTFLERVRQRSEDGLRLPGVEPVDQVVAAAHHELVALLGPVDTRLATAVGSRPAVVLVLGLQGSGKTTTTAKLALHAVRRKGRKPLLVAADLQRPAADAQLRTLAAAVDVPVFGVVDAVQGKLAGLLRRELHPAEVCRQAIEHAERTGRDLVLVDTAGRLHIDAALMAELKDVARVARPDQTLLVCDAMAGQDAMRSARAFREAVPFDGVVLTKTDGDTRGGAALAVKEVTGQPIVFLGTGEKLEDLEEVRPEGLASRILGKGDVARLVELAREHVDREQAERSAKRLRSGKLNYEDFLQQLRALEAMGLKRVLGLLPGAAALGQHVSGDELKPIEAMICSMTPKERRNPALLSGRSGGRRRRRIARGSGRKVQEVNRMVKEFKRVRRLLGGFPGA